MDKSLRKNFAGVEPTRIYDKYGLIIPLYSFPQLQSPGLHLAGHPVGQKHLVELSTRLITLDIPPH
jgi:hypothetical protein